MRKDTLGLIGKVVGLVLVAMVVMIAVHMIGGQSILPWASFFVTILLGIPSVLGTGGSFDLSLNITRTIESNQNNSTMRSPRMSTFDWSDDAKENYHEVNNNPQWRRVEESGYDSWRKVGSILHSISNQVQSIHYVSERRIRAGLIFVTLMGFIWFFVMLIELFASQGYTQFGFGILADISPLNYTVRDLPILQLASSLLLFLLPIGYLDWKAGTSCNECGSTFSLESRGKYWHPELKEQKTRDGSKVTVYHGVRFRECENCGAFLENTNYSWEESA